MRAVAVVHLVVYNNRLPLKLYREMLENFTNKLIKTNLEKGEKRVKKM